MMGVANVYRDRSTGASEFGNPGRIIRYDPKNGRLGSPIEDFQLSRGSPVTENDPLILDSMRNRRTGTDNIAIVYEFREQLFKLGTAATRRSPLWPTLPTIANYADLDAIDDLDAVQSAFLKATKRLGW